MRRGSSPSLKTAVPYSDSNLPAANIDVGQTEILNSRSPTVISSAVTSNQSNESMNWPNSSINSSVGQSFQTTSIFTSYQNQPTLQPDSVNQPNYSQSVPISQESNNLRYQTIFPPPPTTLSSSSNFPPNSASALNTTFSSFPEKSKLLICCIIIHFGTLIFTVELVLMNFFINSSIFITNKRKKKKNKSTLK